MTRYKDINFFHKLDISTTNFEDGAVSWNFQSVGIALLVESSDATDIIEYSFDSTTVHGDLSPTLPSQGIIFDNRSQSKVWFRRKTAGAAVTVRVEAWRN